jgi:hypothetical protein
MCCGRAQGPTSRLGAGGTAETRLVPVTASGLEGGPGVHIGSDSLEDGWSLGALLWIRGRMALY